MSLDPHRVARIDRRRMKGWGGISSFGPMVPRLTLDPKISISAWGILANMYGNKKDTIFDHRTTTPNPNS